MPGHGLHPIAAITQAETSFSFGAIKPVKLGIRPCEFEYILKEIEKKLDRFNGLVKASTDSYSLTDDRGIKQMQDEGRIEIIKSSFDKSFLEEYREDMDYNKTAKELLDFLKEVIGVESTEKIAEKAENKLIGSTRKIATEEKFTRFLTRLNQIAKKIGDNQEINSHLVNRAFRKNLTPDIIAYLRDHDRERKTAAEIAEFLDKKEKYKKHASLNAIGTSDAAIQRLDSLEKTIQNTLMQFTTLMQNKAEETDETNDNLRDTNDSLRLDINKLAAQLNARNTHVTRNNGAQIANHYAPNRVNNREQHKVPQNHQQNIINQYPAEWELNRYGAPYRCRRCGIRGHRDFNCKGTDKSCDDCGQVGHIKPACPKRQTTQYGQRSSNHQKSLNY